MTRQSSIIVKLYCLPIILTGHFFSLYASAEAPELTFVAALSYQNKTLDFKQQYSGGAENNANFSVNLPVLNGALTGILGPFFATIKLENSVASTSANTEETDRSLLGQGNLIAVQDSETNVSRVDGSFTLGYAVAQRANIFVGYLYGETLLEPDPFCQNPFAEIPCSISNRAYYQYFLEEQGFIEDQLRYKQLYSESGPFIGASYTKPIGEVGSLSFSFAYAIMDGEYQDNANDPDEIYFDPAVGAATFLPFHYTGDTKGTSIAVTWSSSLGDKSAWFVDLRSQKYEMEGTDDTFTGIDLKTEEKMLGASLGLRFYF